MQMPYLLKMGTSEILDLRVNGMVPKSVKTEWKVVQAEIKKKTLKK